MSFEPKPHMIRPSALRESGAHFFDFKQVGKQQDSSFDFGLSNFSSSIAADRLRSDPAIDKAFDLASINPLVSMASPLLWLAGRLTESIPPENIEEFRRRVIAEIRYFETAARAKNISAYLVRMSHYALCAVLDDIILNTGWGASSGWASSSLVSILYNETWGGERFYNMLSQLLQQPEQNVDALELMAICLALGFSGKYRVMEGGQGQLARLRHDLYRVIRRVRGPYEKNLSASWVGISAPYKAPASMYAPWVVVAFMVLLLVSLWAFSSISLRKSVDQAAEQIRALVPSIPIVVEHASLPDIPKLEPPIQPPPQPPVQPPPRPPVVHPTQIGRITTALASEITSRRIEVAEVGDQMIIRLLSVLFPSGRTDLSTSEAPLLKRIATTLDKERGPILVAGYTDNVPVGAGSPLGDNMAISLARARSAAQMLKNYIKDPTRITFEGHGQNDPIASNETSDGRARNRRVEFRFPMEKSP